MACRKSSTGKFAKEFLLVHAVLESFAAVDENDGNFVVELAAEFGVAVDIDFLPGEAATTGEFDQALLDDFAEMATLARINDDRTGVRHAGRF
jgi:hypothetical protein